MGDYTNLLIHNFIDSLIYWGAGHGNILPLTSLCNVRCVFCSNAQNPPGVEVFNIQPRSLEQVQQTLELMDRDRPIIIGESVTRINEGEPLSHPKIKQILPMVRTVFPSTRLQITTNGSLLDEQTVNFLKSLAPLTIYLSLNSADTAVRNTLMGDSRADKAIKGAELLGRKGLDWHGSVVAMPHITDWDDLRHTIHYLDQCGARTIRVFLPGFTKLAPVKFQFPLDLPEQLYLFIQELKTKYKTPITLEPPMLDNLRPEVAGVLLGSPAYQAGVRQGDVIYDVNGKAPFSRVDAFHLAAKEADPKLTLHRPDGRVIKVLLKKRAGSRSGLVMDYDIDPAVVRQIKQTVLRHGAGRVLLLTSFLAEKIIRAALENWDAKPAVHISPVDNKFFGGSIKTAGLLVLEDIQNTLHNYLLDYPRPDLIILPQVAFDNRGRDLTGRSWLEMEQKYNIPVDIL